MTQAEKAILGEILDILHKVSATTAALEETANNPAEIATLRNKQAKSQQSVFQSLAERVRDLPTT